MNKQEHVKFLTDAIKQAEGDALVFNINVDREFLEEDDDDEDGLYIEFEYQIDDRIRTKYDEEIRQDIKTIIGNDYGVSVDRVDAFPNGYAAYKVTIDK